LHLPGEFHQKADNFAMKDADELPPQILWLRGYEMKRKKANPFAESTLQADNDVRAKWIKAGCWTAFILLALLEVWTGRNYTDPDGISYIDMSDGVLAHNWRLLVNAYWSPLYPFLLGGAVDTPAQRLLGTSSRSLREFCHLPYNSGLFQLFLQGRISGHSAR
jgi:hypothetical protein